MNRVLFLALAVLLLASCKPQKPWSPYDKGGGIPNELDKDSHASSFSKNVQFGADIGDVEQAVFIKAQIAQGSTGPNIRIVDTQDRINRLVKSTVTITPPQPESLWANFEVNCSRNFMDAPAVVRARIMVADKVAGSFSAVLGTKAMKNGVSAKVDLFKPFQGQLPDGFLAKVDGDLYLMPQGTDEEKLNPETATSDVHSKVIYGTLLRVEFAKDGATQQASAATASPAQ